MYRFALSGAQCRRVSGKSLRKCCKMRGFQKYSLTKHNGKPAQQGVTMYDITTKVNDAHGSKDSKETVENKLRLVHKP